MVESVWAERWSYSGRLWSVRERKSSLRSKTREKDRICRHVSQYTQRSAWNRPLQCLQKLRIAQAQADTAPVSVQGGRSRPFLRWTRDQPAVHIESRAGYALGPNLVVAEDQIRQNLCQLCSDLRRDDGIHGVLAV